MSLAFERQAEVVSLTSIVAWDQMGERDEVDARLARIVSDAESALGPGRAEGCLTFAAGDRGHPCIGGRASVVRWTLGDLEVEVFVSVREQCMGGPTYQIGASVRRSAGAAR